MQIIHQYQPKGSSLCGQACIAMILGCPLDKIIKLIGKGCTTGPQLSKILNDNNICTSPSQIRLNKWNRIYRNQDYIKGIPKRCIAKVRSEGIRKCHWILFWDEKEYDPYPGRVPWQYISGYLKIN